jgi:hypothetical protein
VRSGWFPLVPWGLGVVVVAVAGRLVFDLEWLPFLLLGGQGLFAAAWGVATALVDRRGHRPFAAEDPHVVVEGSLATVAATVGLSLCLMGLLAVGQSFTYPGLLVLAFGLGGLAREARAERRALARARSDVDAPGSPTGEAVAS